MEETDYEAVVHQSASMPLSNGYISLDSTDGDERVGVFDYITPAHRKPDNDGPFATKISSLGTGSSSDSAEEIRLPRNWATGSTTFRTADELANGTELKTFRHFDGKEQLNSSSDNNGNSYLMRHPLDSKVQKEFVSNGNEADEDLEEVVVQTEIVPQQASYERYNPDYHAARRWSGQEASSSTATEKTVPLYIKSVNRSNGNTEDGGDEGTDVENSSLELGANRRRYDGSSSRDVAISELDDMPHSRLLDRDGTIDTMPRGPNIVYLDNFLRSSFLPDGYDERFGMIPRSEAGRRIMLKRQKREQRKAVEETATHLSEDITDYKGALPVEELVAFINNAKLDDMANNITPNHQLASSAAAAAIGADSKERSSRRKKKTAIVGDDIPAAETASDAASSIAEDLSSCSGSEAVPTSRDLVTVELASSSFKPIVKVATDPTMSTSIVQADFAEQFVEVRKKKKKTKQQMMMMYSNHRQSFPDERSSRFSAVPYSSRHISPSRPSHQQIVSGRGGFSDDVNSWASDTQSDTSSVVRTNEAASIRSYSPDFPDLIDVQQLCVRRNSTGNVCGNTVAVEKSQPSNVISYAVIAASGLSSTASKADVVRRQSVDAVTSVKDTASSLSDTSSTPFAGDRSDVGLCTMVASSASADANLRTDSVIGHVDVVSKQNAVIGNNEVSGQNTISTNAKLSIGTCDKPDQQSISTACHATPLTSAPQPASLASAAQPAKDPRLHSEKPPAVARKSSQTAVVFLDASSTKVVRQLKTPNSIGISFGFDDVNGAPAAVDTVPEAKTDSCSRCFADHLTDKTVGASVSSIDSATSPIDPQDFETAAGVEKPVMTPSLPVCHGRPIIPLSATSHQVTGNTPVGIVPPIPHVERHDDSSTTANADDCDAKIVSSKELKIRSSDTSTIIADVRDKSKLAESLSMSTKASARVVKDSRRTEGCEASSNASASSGSFNLLNCQIFLYKGFEDTEMEKHRRPGKVLAYSEDM